MIYSVVFLLRDMSRKGVPPCLGLYEGPCLFSLMYHLTISDVIFELQKTRFIKTLFNFTRQSHGVVRFVETETSGVDGHGNSYIYN